MASECTPMLDIIVPFHGEDISCIHNLQAPEGIKATIRTIFVYDGKMIDHIYYDDIQSQLTGANLVLSNLQENGAGGSRNLGLKSATARYVCFADSDDYIDFQSLEEVLGSLEPSDIIFFKSASKFDDLDGAEAFRSATYNDAIDKYNKYFKKEMLKNIYVPWSKVFRLDFLVVNNIQFNEVEASNDVMFSIISLVEADLIATNDTCFYTVIDSKSSLTKKLTKSSVLSRFSELSKYNIYLRKNTKWKLHPMSSQIFLCFRVSFFLGLRAIILSIWNRFPLFYGVKHIIYVIKQRGFSVLK